MFKYIKLSAEKAAKSPVKDAVLTVPSFWTIHQRKFLVEASVLADLNVLALISENTAASLNYMLSQRATNNTETILFYNLGSNSVQMTIAQFKQEKSEKTKTVDSVYILGEYGQPYVGGLSFDHLLAKYFGQKF